MAALIQVYSMSIATLYQLYGCKEDPRRMVGGKKEGESLKVAQGKKRG